MCFDVQAVASLVSQTTEGSNLVPDMFQVIASSYLSLGLKSSTVA
jgi:hypothetical protein